MSNNHKSDLPAAHLETPRKAGDIEPFPSGKITYLAPLPLPTPMPPHGSHIGELNDVYMDFGLGSSQVFSWQVILGGPLTVAFSVAFLFPLIGGFMFFLFGMSWDDIAHAIAGIFHEAKGPALQTGILMLLIGLAVWHHNNKKRATLIPKRKTTGVDAPGTDLIVPGEGSEKLDVRALFVRAVICRTARFRKAWGSLQDRSWLVGRQNQKMAAFGNSLEMCVPDFRVHL